LIHTRDVQAGLSANDEVWYHNETMWSDLAKADPVYVFPDSRALSGCGYPTGTMWGLTNTAIDVITMSQRTT
jgi:hypothetical protein